MASEPALRQELQPLDAAPQAVLSSNAVSFELLLRRRPGFYRQYGKRALDLTLGLALLLLALPLILVLACLVVVTSGWSPFYVATRLGRDGKEFRLLKLRTMIRDAENYLVHWQRWNPQLAREYEANFKLQEDPRITPLGRFLRRASLDELPQLWNVVRGEMSLVGPRPIVQDELRHYGTNARLLLTARPGMTGRWQVEGRGSVSYPERAMFELETCAEVHLTSGLATLARTAGVVLRLTGS